MYIDKVEGFMVVIFYFWIGKRILFYCFVVGKVLIVFKEKDELEKILSGYEYIE